MNEGVLLALPESSTSESLSQIEDKGCRILVCGTCTNHFGVTEKIKVGTISNMYEITEQILEAQKTITIS
jgi:sulfur relay (sulfurtransferase) complex TusBCD TusD component (DsrE family)